MRWKEVRRRTNEIATRWPKLRIDSLEQAVVAVGVQRSRAKLIQKGAKVATVEHNEVCGACDFEGLVLIDTEKAETFFIDDEPFVGYYEWDCPKCQMDHIVSNDTSVGLEMAKAWVDEGWNPDDHE